VESRVRDDVISRRPLSLVVAGVRLHIARRAVAIKASTAATAMAFPDVFANSSAAKSSFAPNQRVVLLRNRRIEPAWLVELGGSIPAKAERTPAKFDSFVKAEIARWSPILKAASAEAK
jgi:hypothetical protein